MFQRVINFMLALFVACLCIQPLNASESEMLNRIGEQLEQYPVIRAEFVQTKKMLALKRPLVSTGQLTYSHSHGVLWQIHQPYRVSYVLGEESIVEIDANGVKKVRSVREVPGLAQVGRVFRAMLGANTTTLLTYFDAELEGAPDKWKLALTPRQPQLAKALSTIQLAGSQFVDTIVIQETGGDVATIRFKHVQGASTLNQSESQLFGVAP
jgi:hypothetical protein